MKIKGTTYFIFLVDLKVNSIFFIANIIIGNFPFFLLLLRYFLHSYRISCIISHNACIMMYKRGIRRSNERRSESKGRYKTIIADIHHPLKILVMKYAGWVQIEVIFGAVSLTMPSKNCRTSWVAIDIYRWPVKNSFSRFSPVNTRYCMHSIPTFSRYSQIGMYDFLL